METKPDTPLVGRVRAEPSHKPHRDGSITYRLVWKEHSDGVERTRHLPLSIATIPKPGKRDIDDARWRAQLAAEKHAEALHGGPAAEMPIEPLAPRRAADRFLVATRGRLSPHTVRGRKRAVNGFAAWVTARGIETTDRIAQQDAEAWADERRDHLRQSSLNCELCHLQAFLSHAWRQRWTAHKIDLAHLKQRVGSIPPEPLLTREVRRALQALHALPDPRKRLAAYLLAATGLRREELAGLPARAWRADARLLHLEGGEGTTKNHRRDIPVGKETARRIHEYLGHRPPEAGEAFWHPPVTSAQIAHWLRAVQLGAQRLRQHFFTRLTNANCPTIVAEALMGHALPTTQRAYYQGIDVERVREHVQGLEDLLLAE